MVIILKKWPLATQTKFLLTTDKSCDKGVLCFAFFPELRVYQNLPILQDRQWKILPFLDAFPRLKLWLNLKVPWGWGLQGERHDFMAWGLGSCSVDGELLQIQVHQSDVYMFFMVIIGWEKHLALEKENKYMDFSAQKGFMNQPVNEMWMLTSCSHPWTPSLTLQVPEDRLWFNEIQTYGCDQHPHNQLQFERFVGISFDYLLEPGFSGRLVIFDCNSWRSRCWEHPSVFWRLKLYAETYQLLCPTGLVYVDELSHQPGFLWK